MQEYTSLKNRKTDNRPYERCEKYGPASLTDAELLAVIIRTGTIGESSIDIAERILCSSPADSGLASLYHLSLNELTNINGIGKVKAIQILCVAELSKRLARSRISDAVRFDNPQAVSEYYMEEFRHKEHEVLKIIYLDTKNRLLCDMNLSEGTVNSSLASPREIFIEALRHRAVYIMLLHNHPSGDPSPSNEDILFTQKIIKSGEMIDIHLLDHIIIGDNCYCSLKERGLI
ncbi:MAG: DNA repair protein RadC [Lachnospiraceae bacterium]|nr:DNA repair protein RadC [Lachnospiraceae bacterium]